MLRFPLVGLEGVEVVAGSEGAAIAAAGRLAAATMPALPIRNRRRDGERSTAGATAELSRVAGLTVDIVDLPGNRRSGSGGGHPVAAARCHHSDSARRRNRASRLIE